MGNKKMPALCLMNNLFCQLYYRITTFDYLSWNWTYSIRFKVFVLNGKRCVDGSWLMVLTQAALIKYSCLLLFILSIFAHCSGWAKERIFPIVRSQNCVHVVLFTVVFGLVTSCLLGKFFIIFKSKLLFVYLQLWITMVKLCSSSLVGWYHVVCSHALFVCFSVRGS